MQPSRWGALFGAALALAGCDDPSASSQTGSASSSSQQVAAPKRYASADLPKVGERLPPLDEGRVEFAAPLDWRTLPRDRKYVARFVKGKEDNSLPRITVSAMPAPEGVEDVTKENASDFAAAMQEQSKAVAGRKMLEPERPIVLGDYAWSRHVRQLRGRAGDAAVQSLATARGGRLYVIELTVESASDANEDFAQAILAHRNTAYAVAASWKFVGDGAASTPAASETPAASDPAVGDKATEKKGD
jgi:hypothetical protein